MNEVLTVRQIVDREGACVVIMRGGTPIKAMDKYPPAKAEAARLTVETGIEHVAALVMVL